MTLLIKYASRGRPNLFFNSMENIRQTISTKDYRIIVSCDLDDVSMNNEHVRERLKQYPNATIFYNNTKNKVEAINANMDGVEFDLLVNYSDDMKFVVNGWDEKMIASIKSVWGDSLDFFAHFSDGFVHAALPTMTICGYDYYKRENYIYNSAYKSISCDAEEMFKAMMLGKHHYFPEVYFHHIHPGNIPFKADDIYVRNNAHGEEDTRVYFERMKKYFYIKDPVMIPEQLEQEIKKINAA